MARWAIGTGAGGSVRIPAAWKGVTGLNTTIGWISTFDVLRSARRWTRPARVRRDVEGCGLLLAVLQGEDRRGRMRWVCTTSDPMPELRRDVKGTRLGRLPNDERDGIDAAVLVAYDRSVDALANLGGEIVDVALPTRFADLGAINGRIMSAEAYAALAELVDDRAQPRDQDVPRVRAGASISSRDYLFALAAAADEGVVQRCHQRHQ